MKVVAEIKHWANRSYGRNYQVEWIGQAETGDKLVTLAEAEAAVKQARIDALEEAQKVADKLSGFLIGHCDQDGAEIALSVRDSIRSLKETP